ncbi:SLC13 family permease [Thiothrix nivea]|uniref:TrkA-C domain protein n=1 Tax=Thiothrix nivea (strain ATCC 35100 / DSM 5205 / JP2) TaxID=870187 RepID=A0A656HK32_THINJ|nr:SLC13 family permease [Thiothrix nivea]EIJ35629.1 TrkA-C domain protein [Thiothrix nivea DSM 5205]
MPQTIKLPKMKTIAATTFPIAAVILAYIAPSAGIAWVTTILMLTVYLFAFEVVSVDVAAIVIMVLLGLTALFAPVMGLDKGLVPADHLFAGFSSNAVISIIAVMIIGAGLDKTGLMTKVAAFILRVGGTKEKGIIPIISGTVAFISSFMQNVGAAALFLPVVSRISNRSGIPMSRLLMPMGFCAILGGTVTMIGSSPLILLNDLILTSNKHLPSANQLHTWELFDVTPIGLTLVTIGILYFVLAGRFVLPAVAARTSAKESTLDYLKRSYGISLSLTEMELKYNSPLVGRKLLEVEKEFHVRVVALKDGDQIRTGVDALDRDTEFRRGQTIGLLTLPQHVTEFAEDAGLEEHQRNRIFGDLMSDRSGGIAEIVIPTNSNLLGKSAIDVWMRKRYGISLMGILRNGEVLQPETEKVDEIRAIPFQAGDMLLVYATWPALERLEKDRDFIVVTTDYPRAEAMRPTKVGWALAFFAIALSLVLFTELKLSVALLTGAIGMVLSGVLKIDEAYQAVSWRTVFLLASLIPLGYAVESTGTAKWIAESVLAVVGDMPIWIIQASIAVLATVFTLVMSNVGATVLLVPLAVNIAIGVGANPSVFALIVALATSNSFIIPTHQVNALIMGPAGYRVPDFMKAGGIMTILFLVVLIGAINLLGYS